MTRAADDVIAERDRQISVWSFSFAHDNRHKAGELAAAAVCYTIAAFMDSESSLKRIYSRYWPWDCEWWKPTTRRRNLVKAAALIIAEIERLDRMDDLTVSDQRTPHDK